MRHALVLITLLPCFHHLCAASSSSSSPWFLGCVKPSSIKSFEPKHLDSASCSALCKEDGYRFAASSPETCYCGNQLHALVVCDCFNMSLSEETVDVKRGRRAQSDKEEETVALIRSEGPLLLNISVSLTPDQAGRTFGVKVPGNLAAPQLTDVQVSHAPSTLHLSISQLPQGGLELLPSDSSPAEPVYLGVSLQTHADAADDPLTTGGDVSKKGCNHDNLTDNHHINQQDGRILILPHEPAGELLLDNPVEAQTKQKCSVLFNVTALLVNTALLSRNGSFATAAEAAAVSLFNHSGAVVMELQVQNRLSSHDRCVRMCVKGKRTSQDRINPTSQLSAACSQEDKAVRIHAKKQAYPTNTDINFTAVAEIRDPVEFFWDFGDSRSTRTTSRTIVKRYQNPGSYDVVVVASWGWMNISSDTMKLVIQRAVKLNKLVHQVSVVQNQTVSVGCRVDLGTDLTFSWSFGDGTTRSGQSTAQHVFHRSGEFTITVTVSNLISSASLSSHIFVVDRPCQPPPVKNMGPLRLQVRRYEEVRLGVTFETNVLCDTSKGLSYTWTLFDSAGLVFPLNLTNTREQSIVLQSHLLQYGTYTAIARVQIIGSVVYSNHTVRFEVMPSPPVAFIQGGTNIFIDKKSETMITLDGRASYDSDFPLDPLSYTWRCQPVSSIISSCFSRDVPTSSPEFRFPIGLLRPNFDQFQITLTIHSGERSSSSDTFLTIMADVNGRVSVYCHQCQGDQLNWDQFLSVSATCEGCNVTAESVQYLWSLHLVNASSKPATEVPFCYAAELRAPFAIAENPSPFSQTLGMFPDFSDGGTTTNPADSSNSDPSTGVFIHQDNRVHSEHLGEQISEIPDDPETSADWEYVFPSLESEALDDPDDFKVPFPVEEADPGMSAGRLGGVNNEQSTPGEEFEFAPALIPDEGSNLLDPKPSAVIQKPTVLGLHRDAVDGVLFESYTYTGIASSLLKFKPFSLRPKSMYMLDVSAKFQNTLLGRTQLFLRTRPVPEGLTCQVQPAEGMELNTHFSIFCTSGQEDLMYKYSFSVGDQPPRVLYQGRDFQYYFCLPSGDPSDDFKVTIYTEIRRGIHGSATKPCPITVQVKPSFIRGPSSSSPSHSNPDLKLSEAGLRTLSALVHLGNSAEIRNSISLLSSILNRLSRDAEADAHAQKHMRNVLICVTCGMEIRDRISVEDNIFILNGLLQVSSQVTLESIGGVMSHVQAVLGQFSTPGWSHPDQRMLYGLVSLISHSLQVVTSWDFTPKTPNMEPESPTNQSQTRTGGGCMTGSANHLKQEGSIPIKQLVDDILHTASKLVLRRILSQESPEITVSSGLIRLHASSLNHTSTIIRTNSTTVYLPASLIEMVFGHLGGRSHPRPEPICILTVLTELSQNPYSWALFPTQFSGPVVDFNLYKCSNRRIHVRSLLQPISVELQHPHRNTSSGREFILPRSRINYHNFSIHPEHIHQAIQVTVVFTPPSCRAFPIMLLFRMFERPTPRMHHLQRVHQWEGNSMHVTLPPSYLTAAGVGHLALLDADFEKVPSWKHKSDQISYSLTVGSSLCLSWHGQQGVWTHQGCRTQQTETSQAVTCSCYHLRPVTVSQQQIQSSHDTAALDQFLSVSRNVTVLGVLILLLVLCIPGLVWCKREDIVSEENRRAHYLSDNDPSDSCLYNVCIHTGLCSAACMTAKVYIKLCGEHGASQTKELKVPGCTLFRRNSQDTFLLSAANSLGRVWGVHIWHDNSGPSPDWNLKQVVVSEVEGRSWVFVSESWLAAHRGDGQVERMLRVRRSSCAKVFFVKFSDFLADFHIWMSVFCCPSPHSFTHTQRLCVCVLLLSGYVCTNAVIVSLTDDQLPFDLGIMVISPDSITTGLLSVAVVLPAAFVVSFLFRLSGIKSTGPAIRPEDTFSVKDGEFESHSTLDDLQTWTQGGRIDRYKDTDIQSVSQILENKSANEILHSRLAKSYGGPLMSESSVGPEPYSNPTPKKRGAGLFTESGESESKKTVQGHTLQNKSVLRVVSLWCCWLAWVLCLLVSLLCVVISTVLGVRFSSSKALLWTQSLFVSLISCIFLIQPTAILAGAVAVSFWHKKNSDVHRPFTVRTFQKEILKFRSHNKPLDEQFGVSDSPKKRSSHIERLLRARQRARYLRLVRPPTSSDVRKTRAKRRREDLIHQTFRDLCFCAALLYLMMCITYGSSIREHYQLNRAIRRHVIGNHEFISINSQEDWWKWTQTRLLEFLFPNKSNITEHSYAVIGELIMKKMERANASQSLNVSTAGLGHTKSESALKLDLLRSSGWLSRQTVALMVQFTLYSPAPNLFSSVTLLTGQSTGRGLLLSAKVQSARVYPSSAGWAWYFMVCQLLFLFFSLLQLSNQASSVAQQGLMGHWRTPSTWLDVSLLTATLAYYIFCIYHSIVIMKVVNLLQKHNNRGHVDVSDLATQEQCVRSLCGIILFLLTMKSMTVLRVNRTISLCAAPFAHSVSSIIWPTISGLILLVALSCLRNLLHVPSWAFSSVPHSLQTLPCYHHGALFLSACAVCSAMMTGAVSSFVRSSKRSRIRTNAITKEELINYFREKVSKFTGRHRKTETDHHKEGWTFCLEELEGLVDELLLRLDVLSNSVHHTNSPDVTSTPQLTNMDTQMVVNRPEHESLLENESYLLRCHNEQKIQKVLHQRRRMRKNCSHVLKATENKLKTKHSMMCSESTSLKNVRAGDVLEERSKQWAEPQDSCWFGKSRSEVLVEVLVHREQETNDPGGY
nr:polycystic kidney disease 1 like 1 [Nothobranchius furzeri]